MNNKLILNLLLLFLLIPQLVFANTNNSDEWSYFDNMSDQALLLTKQGKYEEAKKTLTQFSEQFVKNYPKDDQITMNDLRVIAITTDEAIQAVTAVSLAEQEKIRKVTRLRLVIDALHSQHQPLWKGMEKSVLESFANLKESALSGNQEKFKLQYSQFSQAFDTIYPSLVVDLNPDDIARLDSHLRFLETYDRVTDQNKQEHLKLMEKDLHNLFDKALKNEADPSLIWIMVTTGTVIFATLVYVSWRKYKGEKLNNMKDDGRS